MTTTAPVTSSGGAGPEPVAVAAHGVVKRFGAFTAVDGIDLYVPRGGCFGVLGPNGAGKTTLMKMISCVSPLTEGTLAVLGQDVSGARRPGHPANTLRFVGQHPERQE